MRLARGVLLLPLLLACSRSEERAQQPPIILISVDTLRSDRLPMYGYRRGATPHLDALRRDAVLYQRAYSHAPLTLPSHVSMLTGLVPTEHSVRNNIGYRFDATKHRTLARTLREQGYRTGAAVSSYVLRSETGIADGFDVYDDNVPITAGAATAENQRSGFETLKPAKSFIQANASTPFFLFFHIYEPHAPYSPPEAFRRADPYDGEIAAADAIVGDLIASLKSNGLYDRAMIVFTSDHGEALWEHGEDQHGILLYREVLQVPLVIKHPGGSRAGTTISSPFALRHLFDEILASSGAAGSQPADKPIYSETLYPRIHLGWSELRSLIDGRYHYIESSSPELYDLSHDPSEKTNLIANERRVAAAMRRSLSSFPSSIDNLGPIDPEDAKKLAALGYIGTPQQRSGPLPNPREQIHQLRDLKSAFQLAAEHRNDEATAALRALLATNPALTDVSTRLGEVLLDSGRAHEAVDVYKSAIARLPRFSPDLAIALSIALLKAGRNADASTHASLALNSHPLEAREVLARAALAEGRLADAETHARAAIEVSDRQPRALLLLADVLRTAAQYDAALQTLDTAKRRATELGIAQQGIDHARADILARLDRPDDAITAYRREIERFPHHLQSYANLAVIYRILGRERDADRLLEDLVRANPHAGARALAEKTRKAF